MHAPGYNDIGNLLRHHQDQQSLNLECERGRIQVRFLQAALVRVRATQAPDFGVDFSYAVARTKWPKTNVRFSAGKELTFASDELVVRITKSPCRISFERPDGTVLNRDEPTRGMGWDGPKCRTHRELAADEMFFGCGEKTGPFNKRGQQFANWTSDVPGHTYMHDALYAAIPFLISVRHPTPDLSAEALAKAETRQPSCYGLFFDNTHRTHFNLGQTEDERHYVLEADAGEIDYYFIGGDSVPAVVRGYMQLTGKMWMPPRWALGYQQCRWSYKTADELLTVAREMRRRQIPCDVVYCDIDYMDAYRVWTWHPERFPQPRALTKQLAKQGFRLVTIIDPGVKNDDAYRVCREGKELGMFVKDATGKVYVGDVWPGPSVFPDFTSPRVRAWWGKWQQEFLDTGVAGFWNDMNEPSVFNVKTMPDDNVHEFEGQWVTHKRAHNVYGLCMARASHEGCRQSRPDERPFVITRSAYAGVQRYSMMWLGDNESRWEQLELSISQLLNMSLSGVAFCGVDIGGFGGNTTGELLARWTQAGAFYPFYRNHSSIGTRQQEPWAFGPAIEAVCREAIRLRYRFMPYLYNVFHEAVAAGDPIMRPLFWHFPNDPRTYAVDDQYLLGDALLVAPVLKPFARHRTVYLPAGSDWYDYATGQKLAGGQSLTVDAPLDKLPLYVRAGSIVPTMEPMAHVDEKPVESITLLVYPGPKTDGYLYEDDGRSFGYERGDYALTQFTWANDKLKVVRKKTGFNSPIARFQTVVVGK